MKRFPVLEDREFEIAGEVFRWVYPYWEDIAKVFDADTAEDEATNGDVQDPGVHDTIKDFIQRIEIFIDPEFNDGIKRWRLLTKRRKNPIPHAQYSMLYRWLLETTSMPTPIELPSPSVDGLPSTEDTSTAV